MAETIVDAAISRIARPLSPFACLGVGIAILVAGGLYCSTYGLLVGEQVRWMGAFGWSFGAILPWFVAFEGIKHFEARRGVRFGWRAIVLILLTTGLASLLLERTIDRFIWHSSSAPVGLAVLRRLPALFVVGLCLLAARARIPTQATQPRLKLLARHILYVRAADNYLELHMDGRMTMRRQTLQSAEDELASQGFIRIHRSILVNIAMIERAEANGRAFVILTNGTALPVGSRFRQAVRPFVP